MQDQIGAAAGQVWQCLSECSKPVSVSEIPKLSGLKSPLAYQGLGWLAREGKVWFEKKGQKTLVSLSMACC